MHRNFCTLYMFNNREGESKRRKKNQKKYDMTGTICTFEMFYSTKCFLVSHAASHLMQEPNYYLAAFTKA